MQHTFAVSVSDDGYPHTQVLYWLQCCLMSQLFFFFQLFPLSRLCLFCFFFLSGPFQQRMLLMIWFDTSLLYAGLNIIPSLLHGRDQWSGHLSSPQQFMSVEKHLSLVT